MRNAAQERVEAGGSTPQKRVASLTPEGAVATRKKIKEKGGSEGEAEEPEDEELEAAIAAADDGEVPRVGRQGSGIAEDEERGEEGERATGQTGGERQEQEEARKMEETWAERIAQRELLLLLTVDEELSPAAYEDLEAVREQLLREAKVRAKAGAPIFIKKVWFAGSRVRIQCGDTATRDTIWNELDRKLEVKRVPGTYFKIWKRGEAPH